ncbi:MAG TPA: hypothetical protein PLG79_03165 [Spirochaetales bacterium]|nr:hypothetical protein [Spirochaetales bacterium]
MDRDLRKLLATIAVFLLVGIGFSFIYAYFQLPVLRVGNYKGSWILGAGVEFAVTNFIGLLSAGLLTAASLILGTGEIGIPLSQGMKQLRKFFFVSLAASCFYAILQEAVLPWGIQKKQESIRRTQVTNKLIEKALTASNAKQYSDARFYLEYYTSLVPEDDKEKQNLEKIIEKERESNIAASNPIPEQRTIRDLHNLTFHDLQQKALNYFAEKDFIAAEYFSLLALKLKPSHPEMLRILAASQDQLSRMELTSDQQAKRTLYLQKKEGYEMLNRGDPISAYFHFYELQKIHPRDIEIAKYLQQSYEEVKKQAFFLDEISLLTEFPAGSNLFIRNAEKNQIREFLYLGEIISTEVSYYALDIEGIGIDSAGNVLYQFRAPFGKFTEGVLLMHCLDRTNPKRSLTPVYLRGDPPLEPATILPVQIKPEELLPLERTIHSPQEVPFATAVLTLDTLASAGIEQAPVIHTLLMRLCGPFFCLNFSLLAFVFGRNLRSRYIAHPPAVTYILLPFLPFLMKILLSLYEYETSILAVLLIDKTEFGFYTAAAILMGVQGILLIGILLYGLHGFVQE